MSYVQRIAPLLLATAVGVASGMYIFDGPLKQYKQDTDGTFDPDRAAPHLPTASDSSPDVIAAAAAGSASVPAGEVRQKDMAQATKTAAAGLGGASGDSPIATAIWKQTTEALQEIRNKVAGDTAPKNGREEKNQV